MLRIGEEAAFLRRRMERPAAAGRVVLTLLGVVTLSAGLAVWFTAPANLDLALAAFGGVLIALGIAQHLLHRRDRTHQPEQALLWEDGLELVLQNGEVHGLSWTDPDLALNLVSRRAPPPAHREYLLVWMSDPRAPLVELSEAGYELLKRTAEAHQLTVTDRRRGRRESATVSTEIRQAGRPGDFSSVPSGRSRSHEDQPAE